MTSLRFVRTNAQHTDFKRLVQLLDADLAIRDGEDHAFYAQFNQLASIPYVLLAYVADEAVACAALKPFGESQLMLKRMFVHPDHRRQGIAQLLLAQLEIWAVEVGASQLVLETGVRQPEARPSNAAAANRSGEKTSELQLLDEDKIIEGVKARIDSGN